MRYSEKYNRYVDDDLVIYYWSKTKDKLMQCKIHLDKRGGYLRVHTKLGDSYVHRVLYETMVGEIPDGMTIDHINTIRTDNRLENIRVVTHKENCNNPLTRKHHSEAHIGKEKKFSSEHNRKISEAKIGKPRSEFGKKFKEHFGIDYIDNPKLYNKERMWYRRHNSKCSWEI